MIRAVLDHAPTIVNALLCGMFLGVGVACVNSFLRFVYFEIAVKFSNHSEIVMCVCEAASILLFVWLLRRFYEVYKVLHETLPKAYRGPTLTRAQYEDAFLPGIVGRSLWTFFIVASMVASIVFTVAYVFCEDVGDTSGNPAVLRLFSSGFMESLRFQSFLMALFFAAILWWGSAP